MFGLHYVDNVISYFLMDLCHPLTSVTLSTHSKYGSSYTLSSGNKAEGRLSDKFQRERFINRLLQRYENPLLVCIRLPWKNLHCEETIM